MSPDLCKQSPFLLTQVEMVYYGKEIRSDSSLLPKNGNRKESRIVIQFHLESRLVYEEELNFSFTRRLALLKLTCLVHFVRGAARVGMERVRSTQNECND